MPQYLGGVDYIVVRRGELGECETKRHSVDENGRLGGDDVRIANGAYTTVTLGALPRSIMDVYLETVSQGLLILGDV